MYDVLFLHMSKTLQKGISFSLKGNPNFQGTLD